MSDGGNVEGKSEHDTSKHSMAKDFRLGQLVSRANKCLYHSRCRERSDRDVKEGGRVANEATLK